MCCLMFSLTRSADVGEKTAGQYLVAFGRFLQMVAPAGCNECDGVFVNECLFNMWRSGIISTLRSAPILHPDRSWTRTIGFALLKFAAHLSQDVLVTESDATADALLGKIERTFIKPLISRARRAGTRAGHLKKLRDQARVQDMAPPDVAKVAVLQGYVDMHVIWESYGNQGGDLPPRLRAAANQIAVGSLYNTTLAGRPGPWAVMTAEHAIHQFDQKKGFFCTVDHKTFQTYGGVGKYVNEGLEQMLRLYLQLPRRTGLLFEPPHGRKSNVVSISSCVRGYHDKRLRGYGIPNTALFRKRIHADVRRVANAEKCFALLCRLDAHSIGVGSGTYDVSSPQDDADVAKHMFEVLVLLAPAISIAIIGIILSLSAPRIPPHQPKIHGLFGDASFRKFRRFGGQVVSTLSGS